MEITNLEREALLEKINKQVDDMASNIASAVYVKVHELIVEAAQEIADAEQLTNSGIVHAAMREAYDYALRYAQFDELLERSSCDVISNVPRD
jgi:hypothetical protein